MKQLFLSLLILFTLTGLYAQIPEAGEYEADFQIQIRDGNDNNSHRCTNKFDMWTTLLGEADGPDEWWYQDLNAINTSWKYYSKKLAIPLGKKLRKVRIRGERNWHNLTNCNGNDGWDEFTISYTGSYLNTFTGKIPQWDSKITLSIYAKTMNLYYFNRAGTRETAISRFYLPQSQRITMKATTGYENVVYKWQYQIGSGGWTNFPASLYTGNTLNFCGNDISADFINNVLLAGNNVKVRINYASGKYSTVTTLRPLLSSPEMTDAYGVAPTCSYFSDGKIRIKLNRSFYTGETLTFTLNGLPLEPQNISTQLAGNEIIIEGQASFSSRNLSMKGKFRGLDTYTDDPVTQNKTVSVPVRNPVVFSTSGFDVHCFDGEDGKIKVTASGGTGDYTSYLVLGGDTIKDMSLSAGEGFFTDLETSTYKIHLQDSYHCDSKDSNGKIIIDSLLIDQPDQSVFLSAVENIEPLGYGLTDGHVTVRAEQGSGPYTFEWKNNAGTVLTANAPEPEGASMKSTLPDIGTGIYRVMVKDDHYALASPQTSVNIRGCYDTLSMFVDQPPLLEIALALRHVVTCHDDSDGEIVAHAKGGRPYLTGHIYQPYQYEWFVVNADSTTTPFGVSDSISSERPSARYRVKITDRNGITAWSKTFRLVQPDALVINFATSELLCNGDKNGTSLAIPQGGTPRYRYVWSTEDTTAQVHDLIDGIYSVVVIDSRECTTLDQTEVKVPNSIKAEATVTPPTCSNYQDGVIVLDVSDGRPGYRYAWSNGDTTAINDNLEHGTYTVTITDKNNCFIVREYPLENPALLPLELGPDRVLCRDQSLSLNTEIGDPAAQYTWIKDGASFATTPAVELLAAGNYKVTVKDGKGCINNDEITISRDETEIAASLTVATRVPQGGKFRVANITHPLPDKTEWIIPANATVVTQTPEFLDLIFMDKGAYEVGIKSYQGQCEKAAYSTIRVVDKSELADYISPDEPYIKRFSVSPNPNNGRFTATIELKEAGNFKLVLYASQSNIIRQETFTAKSFVNVDYDLSENASGIYMLQLITGSGYSIFKIMIDK